MARKQKQMTNVELVTNIMEFSRYGAMAQLFVMDALHKFADKVAAANPQDCESAMISGEAWVGVAKEIQEKLNRKA